MKYCIECNSENCRKTIWEHTQLHYDQYTEEVYPFKRWEYFDHFFVSINKDGDEEEFEDIGYFRRFANWIPG